MSRGADIGARDSEGTTAAYHARKHRHQPIVSYLLDTSGDGDVLLVEEQSLINEVHTADGEDSPLYTRVCKKNKKKLRALDYEEVEQSFDRDNSKVETVKGSQDAGNKSRPRPTDKKKDAKKSEKRMVYENTEFPLAPEGGHASVSNTPHNNSAKDTSSCDEKQHVFETSREDFGLVSDSDTKSTALSERAAFDQCDENNEVAKYKLTKLGRRQHCYEEIKLPNDFMTDPTVSHGCESVEESINMTKAGFSRRNHTYEEIELPSDTMPHVNVGLHNRNAFPCTATPNVIANSFSRNQYEELNISSDSADPNSNILKESATEEEIIPTIDISKFVRRQHPYEEIKLPCDEDSNKIHLDEHQVEQEVRQLLREEMRKLELMGNAVDVDNSSRGSDAIKNFVNASEIAEEVAPDSHYDVTAVITLPQLRRLFREEFQRFADQLRLTEPLSKIGVENKEDRKIVLTSTSTRVPSETGLYDEIATCNFGETGCELGRIEAIKPAPRKENDPREKDKEKKHRDDSPSSLPQTTDRRKPEITEQTKRESKFNFSPLLLRRDPRTWKQKGNESRSPHRSPLRMNAQNDKVREANGPKTEQDLQKWDELSVKAGQSQFYVSLAQNNIRSEI